jgi:hypothetical protein
MKAFRNRVCAVGLAVMGFTLVAAPTLSSAETNQARPAAHAGGAGAKKHLSRQWQPNAGRNLYGSAQGRCAWPYQNQFPPCMSTFPSGSPSYHGPVPGPTFDDE